MVENGSKLEISTIADKLYNTRPYTNSAVCLKTLLFCKLAETIFFIVWSNAYLNYMYHVPHWYGTIKRAHNASKAYYPAQFKSRLSNWVQSCPIRTRQAGNRHVTIIKPKQSLYRWEPKSMTYDVHKSMYVFYKNKNR